MDCRISSRQEQLIRDIIVSKMINDNWITKMFKIDKSIYHHVNRQRFICWTKCNFTRKNNSQECLITLLRSKFSWKRAAHFPLRTKEVFSELKQLFNITPVLNKPGWTLLPPASVGWGKVIVSVCLSVHTRRVPRPRWVPPSQGRYPQPR